MVVLAVLACLRLGWWQWDRSHESTGTVQNLGYAVLWPVFGAAFIYMWFRFLQLELLKDTEEGLELEEFAASGTSTRSPEVQATRSGPEVRSDFSDTGQEAISRPESARAVPESAPIPQRVTSAGYFVASSTVGDEQQDQDPELAAYNRALAALAAKDRRAR